MSASTLNRGIPVTAAVHTEGARVSTIDVLRGFVMVLMALDHTREFFTNWAGNPLDPEHTTLLLYASRWVTHICAPVFVFLAGTSIFLQQQRKNKSELTRFLLTRGLWLIVVELTLVKIVFTFHWQWNVQVLEVIWAIGASMTMMAALIHIGVRGNAMLAVLLIAGHNALDGVMSLSSGPFGWLWRLLHVPGFLGGPPVHPPIVIVAYPLLPWIGVMALGFAFGTILYKPRAQRIRFEVAAGAAMLSCFALLRWTNLYGDPSRWTIQANWWRTMLSFLNVQKYPPSLLFLLATLGIAALLLAVIELAEGRPVLTSTRRVLETYGRVPLFYFLLHIALIHALALIAAWVTGGDWRWWITEFPKGGVVAGHPSGYGYGLAVICVVWIAVVTLCFPACKWYSRVRRGKPLLSYV